MKKANNFQIAKVQPRVLLSFCLNFCKFQLGVAYKNVAYEKNACIFRFIDSVFTELDMLLIY